MSQFDGVSVIKKANEIETVEMLDYVCHFK
jgi:hypothetical protein